MGDTNEFIVDWSMITSRGRFHVVEHQLWKHYNNYISKVCLFGHHILTSLT